MVKNLYILLIIGLLFSACGDDNGDARFVIRGEAFIDIPANLGVIETHSFFIRKQPSFFNDLVQQNGLTAEDITAVLPAIATLRSRNTSVSLDFINEVSVRAVSRTNPSNNLEMFYLEFVELNEDQEIRFLPSIANLKSIIIEEEYDIEVRLTLRRFAPTNFLLDLAFELDAYAD